MKSTFLIIALLGAVCAFPKEEKLHLKNVYVKPLIPPPDITSRITNGQEVVPHSIPNQVWLSVTANDGGGWLCGGSLISSSYVLTAGHCVDRAVLAEVYLGAHNINELDTTATRIVSTTVKLHESYDASTIQNDLGLIELPEAVQLNENINVIALPSRGDNNNYEGANVRMSGWGITSGDADLSTVLLEVNSTVISSTQCNQYFGAIADSQLCTAGTGGVGVCNGDSGGPLVAGNVQIGITSFAVEGCLAGYPSGFTRVTSYLDWIEQNTDLTF